MDISLIFYVAGIVLLVVAGLIYFGTLAGNLPLIAFLGLGCLVVGLIVRR